MAEIDGEMSVPAASAGAGSSLTPTAAGERERTRERRERAMAEAALTLAEIGESRCETRQLKVRSRLLLVSRVSSHRQRRC